MSDSKGVSSVPAVMQEEPIMTATERFLPGVGVFFVALGCISGYIRAQMDRSNFIGVVLGYIALALASVGGVCLLAAAVLKFQFEQRYARWLTRVPLEYRSIIMQQKNAQIAAEAERSKADALFGAAAMFAGRRN